MPLQDQVDNNPYVSKDQLYIGDMVVTPENSTGVIKTMDGDYVTVEISPGVVASYYWQQLRPWTPRPIQSEDAYKARELLGIKESAKSAEAHGPHPFRS